MRTAIRVSQSPVRCHIRPASVRVSREGVGATRKVAPSISAPAFLTQPIKDIRPEENESISQYGIDVKASYEHILKCCKRFVKLTGMKYEFTPTPNMTNAQKLGELIDNFDEAIKEAYGLEFFVSKKSPQGEELKVLTCAVYRPGVELEDTVVVMYVSPARYLSPKSSELFKRFIKFFSESTCIPLGVIGNRDNFYIDCILNMYEDDPMYDEDALDDEDVQKRKAISAAYSEDGEFWNLFDEIQCLPKQDAKKLANDIDRYRKDCPIEEVDLMECLYEGIDIVKDMNYYWFEFNPEDDGLPNEYGQYGDEGWASSVFASAILYSEHDGICDMLLESINSEVNAGIMMSGWNIHQYLSPRIEKSVIDDFMRCRDNVGKFSDWIRDFYRNMEIFDKYGETEQSAE